MVLFVGRIAVWDANLDQFEGNNDTHQLKEIWAAKHDTQVGRWVTVFKAQWSPYYDDLAPHVMVGHQFPVIVVVPLPWSIDLNLHSDMCGKSGREHEAAVDHLERTFGESYC